MILLYNVVYKIPMLGLDTVMVKYQLQVCDRISVM